MTRSTCPAATDLVAELTGSLIIDRARGVGYCGLSERCDMAGARAMHQAFDLRLTFCFELADVRIPHQRGDGRCWPVAR